MLVELRVAQLGVIDDLTVLLGPGMTALTGETGAGKTLVVDAIELLTGAPADSSLVRPGAEEALVEGRFVTTPSPGEEEDGAEVVLARVVAGRGRSRCYLDGRMVPLSRFAEVGRDLVDLHGQHAHQSLLSATAQRAALDRAGGIDPGDAAAWRKTVRELRDAQAALGGDEVTRARELDLLTYQLGEIDSAGLGDPREDDALRDEEEVLSDAAGLAGAASSAWAALAGDDGAVDRLGAAVAALGDRRALSGLHERVVGLQAEVSDAAAEARSFAESVEEDPSRLARVGERRRVLGELRRKYGSSLGEVIAYREDLRARAEELRQRDSRAAAVAAELEQAEKELAAAMERLWEARRSAAPRFSGDVEAELRRLAMPGARFGVEVGADPQRESVAWLLGANPGEAMLPLAKVASGGELARTMLAARLVSGRVQAGGGPSTLVFDEVDAGIGGEAALAVGEALAALAAHHQVLVVTHLAQVAAFARSHLAVTKRAVGGPGGERVVARVAAVEGPDRVVELARMLSGRPGSDSARRHAEELLAAAAPRPGAGRSPRRPARRG